MKRSAAQLVRAAARATAGRAAPAPAAACLTTAQCSPNFPCSTAHTEACILGHGCSQRHLSCSAWHSTAAKEELPQLRWPLPADVLAANPELARAALADAAQTRLQAQDAAQPSSDSATQPLEYRDSAGTVARLGGVVKRRTRRHRPPPPDTATAGGPVQLTSMSPDEVAEVMADAHARDVVILDVRQTCDFADSMVIATGKNAPCGRYGATGNSNGHVRAVARAVHSKMKEHRPDHLKENTGVAPLPVEGSAASDWTVVDAGTMIVHVLTGEAREEYNLEGLWAKHGGVRRITSRAHVQTLSTMRV